MPLFPLLFQLHKMLRASPTFADLYQNLLEAKERQIGYNRDGAEPRWDTELKKFLDRGIGKGSMLEH